jgi:gamma-glutamyltranspeptidase/glutathione hydrolase
MKKLNFCTVILVVLALTTNCALFKKAPSALKSIGEKKDFGEFPERDRSQYEAISDQYMIASQGKATTAAARRIFAAGGNVFDAFAAASFAISVERPQSTGLGGGGFLVGYLKDKKKALAVDFREKAPSAASKDMYLDKKREVVKGLSRQGGKASGVPGLVKGVLDIHKKYGKLSRKQVMQPAIDLATKGFAVYPHMEAAIADKKQLLWKNKSIRSVFFNKDGSPKKTGQIVKQPELARTLQSIAKFGEKIFYKGSIAVKIASSQAVHQGLISMKDLSAYNVKYRNPVSSEFRGYRLVSMPPPSSGGTHVAQILKILEARKLSRGGAYDFESVHSTASAMQIAYRDRARYMGDADYVKGGVPTQKLMSSSYIKKMSSLTKAHPKKALKLAGILEKNKFIRLKEESAETTHFTIADKNGNVISSTQTINGWFGSGVFVNGAGFVMNNQMDDFSAKSGVPNLFGLIGGKENSVAAHKRPLSSMSPTLFLKNDKPVLALGTPSGSRIINCVAMVSLNYLVYKKPLWDSVAALRYHHQWRPEELRVESPGFAPKLSRKLKRAGYKLNQKGLGCKVQAISFEKTGMRGVSDPRGEGYAAGHKSITFKNLKGKDAGKVEGD